MGSAVGGIFALTLIAVFFIAAGCIDNSLSEAIQETSSCSLMQKESTGEIGCFGCSGTVCNASETGWKILSNNSERCIATIEGCYLNNSINRKKLAEKGFEVAINESLETVSSERWNAELDCKSDSMGLTVKCGHKLVLEKVSEKDWLKLGGIYTYKSGDLKIVHRLIACADERPEQQGLMIKCSRLVFKGDNNLVGEIIMRENLDARVVSVNYE